MNEWARYDIGRHYVRVKLCKVSTAYLDKRTGMTSCVGAPAAGAFVRELTGDFSGAERAVRTSSSGSLNSAFCGYVCGDGRGVQSVPNTVTNL